jgi:endonuclease/exonuclease/phosphatase family metal-dependent hydrolase
MIDYTKMPKGFAPGMKELKARIAAASIPPSKLDETINVATWNIREFGKKARTPKATYYIAEIISQFDLVSIVELRDKLGDAQRVLELLGSEWKMVYSDFEIDPGANRERVGFIYDTRAVRFTGFASLAQPPRLKSGREYQPQFTWWRAPYMAAFSAGNFDFTMLAMHVRWGDSDAARAAEIASVAEWFALKTKNEKELADRDIIITGDFNISKDSMLQPLLEVGLKAPKPLRAGSFGTNLARDKRYDQLLVREYFPDAFSTKAGVLDFYAGNHSKLFSDLSKDEFTYQVSDHLPLWMQVKTDNDLFQIDQLLNRK